VKNSRAIIFTRVHGDSPSYWKSTDYKTYSRRAMLSCAHYTSWLNALGVLER
jgi:hypothetical protein